MFKSIKLRIIKGRKLLPFATAKVLQEHEDRLNALEGKGSSGGEPETPTRNISITVNDGTDPVQGASVVIDDVTKTTGSAGGCTFNSIAEGNVNVEVSKEGYTTKTETITVSEEDTSFTISLVAVTPSG